MNRDEFMELVYETFADEPDNVLANGIIEAADAYVEHEKTQLSQEDATSDTISRQAAKKELKEKVFRNYTDEFWGAMQVLDELPSVPNNQVNLCDSCTYTYPECPSEINDIFFGNGFGNDNICACNKYQPSVQPVATDATSDTISRQAAIDALDCINGVEDVLRSLPTVQPEPKEGHWIQYDKRFPWRHHYKCSECGNYLDFSGVNAGRGEANYCPNCGADMRETKVKCGDEDTLQGGLMSAT